MVSSWMREEKRYLIVFLCVPILSEGVLHLFLHSAHLTYHSSIYSLVHPSIPFLYSHSFIHLPIHPL